MIERCLEANAVCLTVESAVALGKWARAVVRYQNAIAACPLVKEGSLAFTTEKLLK